MPRRAPRVSSKPRERMSPFSPWVALYHLLPHYYPATQGKFVIDQTMMEGLHRGYDRKKGEFFNMEYRGAFPITRLREKGKGTWMSTSQLEMAGLENPVRLARGKVLTCGLGLGCFAWLAAHRPEVDQVLVVEREADVIALVEPQIHHPKIVVAHSSLEDFFIANDQARFDFIYLDTWGSLLGPLNDVLKAKALAEPFLAPSGEVRLWLQELIDRVLDQLPKEPSEATSFSGIHSPCLVCSKTMRYDFAGLCMDCADELGLSNLFIKGGEVK